MIYSTFHTSDNSIIGIWKIEESETELLSNLESKSYLQNILSIKVEAKRIEKLAVRVLLKHLLGYEVNIDYENSGKPYIANASYNISISHTKNYAAIILNKKNKVGIDIEQISNKIKRIKSKFISDSEYIDTNNEVLSLLLHWTAKETMYKIINKSGVDLKKNLRIQNIDLENKKIYSTFCKDDKKQNFALDYIISDCFILTYT